jgi:hypothetical protein
MNLSQPRPRPRLICSRLELLSKLPGAPPVLVQHGDAIVGGRGQRLVFGFTQTELVADV